MSFYPGRADYANGIISVDEALNNPTTIEQRVAEVASRNLLIESVFSTDSSPVEGGAVIYSQTTEKNFYTENDVAARQPGDEYTAVYRERPEAQLARVQDYGGKFDTTDEARKRNQAIDFDNDVTALSNTITRKLNRVAMETLTVAEESGGRSYGSDPWSDIILDGDPTTITPPGSRPAALFARAQADVDDLDLGIQYQRLVLNPQNYADLRIAYGADLKPMLDDYGLEPIVSNHVPSGKGYLVDPGKLGFVKYEESLTITTWRDEEHRKTWVQGYAMPVMGVTMPDAMATLIGLDA